MIRPQFNSKEQDLMYRQWRGVGFSYGFRLPLCISEFMTRRGIPVIDEYRDLIRMAYQTNDAAILNEALDWMIAGNRIVKRQLGFALKSEFNIGSHTSLGIATVFPTTSVLDSFDRTDENPLSFGGQWTTSVRSGATSPLLVTGNLCAGSSSGANSSFWNIATFTDSEVFATMTTKSGVNLFAIFLGLLGPGNNLTVDGYGLQLVIVGGTDSLRISILTDGVLATLGADIPQEVSDDDSIGLDRISTILTAYYKASGGSWTALSSRNDSTYTTAGNLGMQINNSLHRVNHFGGGNVVGVAGPTPDQNDAVTVAEAIVPSLIIGPKVFN